MVVTTLTDRDKETCFDTVHSLSFASLNVHLDTPPPPYLEHNKKYDQEEERGMCSFMYAFVVGLLVRLVKRLMYVQHSCWCGKICKTCLYPQLFTLPSFWSLSSRICYLHLSIFIHTMD